MKINSQMRGASLENVTSDYSAGTQGRIWYRTDTGLTKFDDGSAIRTFVTTDNTQTLTNKTLSSASNTFTIIDNSFSIKDNSDNTKIAAFECSGITTGTTRTFTFPDADTTLVGTGTTQTLTNKTLTSPTINTPLIAGGTASNTSRIVFPSASLASITALTRVEGAVWYATDTDKLYKDDGTSLTEIGSGSSGSINYISNPDAESGTTGWSTYDDGAATPVDGTGGSVTTTLTATSSSPLRGTQSFLITTTAANLLGEGVAYDFTISNADLAKVLSISFDYSIASGTYTTGDFTVYIIQDPSGTPVVIQPAPYQIQGLTVGLPGKFQATFQTSSTITTYRLLIHRAVSTSAASTIKFDNVVVGPQILSYGAPISDMTAFTPTLNSNTSVSSNNAYYCRRGDLLKIQGRIIYNGTGNNSTLFITIPTGMTIDGNKYSITTDVTEIGTAFWSNSGVDYRVLRAIYHSSTTVAFLLDSGTTLLNSNLLENGDEFSYTIEVPISGWGSTVLMSSDSDTRVVAAVYQTNTATSIANSSTQILDFEDVSFDTHSAVTTGASWKYTCPVSGVYNVSARIQLTAASWTATNQISLYVYKNGSLYSLIDHDTNQVTTTVIYSMGGSIDVKCNAGDYIDVRLNQASGGAIALDGTSTNNTISIHRLSGPSSIAATETVAARYEVGGSTANASITAGATEVIDFESRIFDTHGAVTVGASWKFTAPMSGKYRVSAMAMLLSVADGKQLVLAVYKNTSVNTTLTQVTTGASGNQGSSGSTIVSLLAGDYVDVRITNGDASDRTLSTAQNVWVTVERIGN